MTSCADSVIMEFRMEQLVSKETLVNKYQIFCDLDGVLVDLVAGVESAIRSDPPDGVSPRWVKTHQLAREDLGDATLNESHLNKFHENFSKPIRQFMYRVMSENRHFWMNLPWTAEGEILWSYIKDYDPIILSKPTDLQSVIGKKAWVKRNLGLNKENVQIRYDKSRYAQHNGKTGLLIDDFATNIKAFTEADGKTIHFKNTKQAIEELKTYGFAGSTI